MATWSRSVLVGTALSVALVGMSISSAQAAGTVSPTTVISSSPLSYDYTNGDILAVTKIQGAASNLIAIGGNFSAVITPDHVSHAAKNFAILDESTGAVRYAGNANSYVRALTSRGGTVYAGGDFTTFGGASRSRVAAIGPSLTLTSFNPGSGGRVRALAVDGAGLYIGGDSGTVKKSNLTSSSTVWSVSESGGSVKALMVSPDGGSLFVGGLFERVGSISQHGLVKLATSNGAGVTAFNAHLTPDSGVGADGSFDGEEAISFAATPEGTNLVVGIGGHGKNEIRKVNITSGSLVWEKILVADCQGVAAVGDTYVFGTHRNNSNGSIPYPYFGGQVEGSNDALTSWDPRVTGTQSNADGGNNGVQAVYSDPSSKKVFVAGAFTRWNGGSGHQSLVVFSYS